MLRVDQKHVNEYSVLNVCGLIITSNHKTDGIYLPADDRRHFVAWSDKTKEDFTTAYWDRLHGWYTDGGIACIADYLQKLDLSAFEAKAPPPKTAAFYEIVGASRAPEDAELADVLEALGQPEAVTLDTIQTNAFTMERYEFAHWLRDRKNVRKVPHRLEECGYVRVENPDAKDGVFKVRGRRVTIYARRILPLQERITDRQTTCQGRLRRSRVTWVMKVMISDPSPNAIASLEYSTLYLLRVVGEFKVKGRKGLRKGIGIMTFMTHMTRPPGGLAATLALTPAETPLFGPRAYPSIPLGGIRIGCAVGADN